MDDYPAIRDWINSVLTDMECTNLREFETLEALLKHVRPWADPVVDTYIAVLLLCLASDNRLFNTLAVLNSASRNAIDDMILESIRCQSRLFVAYIKQQNTQNSEDIEYTNELETELQKHREKIQDLEDEGKKREKLLQTAEYQKKTIQELYDALYARIEEYEEKLEIERERNVLKNDKIRKLEETIVDHEQYIAKCEEDNDKYREKASTRKKTLKGKSAMIAQLQVRIKEMENMSAHSDASWENKTKEVQTKLEILQKTFRTQKSLYENCLEEKSELIERISFLEAQHNSENKGNNVVSEEKNVISEDADYDKETVVSSETYQNLKEALDRELEKSKKAEAEYALLRALLDQNKQARRTSYRESSLSHVANVSSEGFNDISELKSITNELKLMICNEEEKESLRKDWHRITDLLNLYETLLYGLNVI